VRSLPDPDLLIAWRAGKLAAGEVLFRRHYQSVERFFHNTVAANDVDDLVQSTFIACAEACDRFEARSSFRTYLFGIAHNVLRSHYRSRTTRGEEPDFQLTSVADLGLGQSTMLEHKRERRVLLEALRSIPLESQMLLQLRYWEELRTAELAQVLGVPRGTAVDRLRRAQDQLQQAIARIDASPDVLASTLASINGWAAALRRTDESDPQLSALIPERLGRCRLVARVHEPEIERASYRGSNTELELELRRLGTDGQTARELEHAAEWTPVSVNGRPARLRWDAASHEVELYLRVGNVAVALRQRPAPSPEATIELLAELALESIGEFE
jgi:RNA polymerase sigma factor (sigma-70 family)